MPGVGLPARDSLAEALPPAPPIQSARSSRVAGALLGEVDLDSLLHDRSLVAIF